MLLRVHEGPSVRDVELGEGDFSVGGAENDTLVIEGLAPRALALRLRPGRAVVASQKSMVVGGGRVPPLVARLWLPGERLIITPTCHVDYVPPLDSKPQVPCSTALVVRSLLSAVPCATPLTPKLTCVCGPDLGRVFHLSQPRMLLGRSLNAAVTLRDLSVSRQHAWLTLEKGSVWIEALSSGAGAFLAGRSLQKKTRLRPGQLLEVGCSVLRFDALPEVEVARKAPQAVKPMRVPSSPRHRLNVWLAAGALLTLASAALVATWG